MCRDADKKRAMCVEMRDKRKSYVCSNVNLKAMKTFILEIKKRNLTIVLPVYTVDLAIFARF